MLGRGRGRGGGRFGGRGGIMGGGGATALDHLRETAEEMGLDPRAAGQQQQEPLPAYPFIPLYPPRPLAEEEGAKIQAHRELVHWWQQSVYYIRPASARGGGGKRAAGAGPSGAALRGKHIARYSDRYKRQQEQEGARSFGANGGGATLWSTIHVPEPKSLAAVHIPGELLPAVSTVTKAGGGKRARGAKATAKAASTARGGLKPAAAAATKRRRIVLEDEEEEEDEEGGGGGEKGAVGEGGKGKAGDEEDEEEEDDEGLGLEDEEEEEDLDEGDDYQINHYASDDYDGGDDLESTGDREATF